MGRDAGGDAGLVQVLRRQEALARKEKMDLDDAERAARYVKGPLLINQARLWYFKTSQFVRGEVWRMQKERLQKERLIDCKLT
jgi:hypothetical protein